jgi:DNA-binding transcriptional regulator of glucitol operon
MTVTILCAVVLVVGMALCAVLAEPWQRPRYDEALDRASDKARSVFTAQGHVTDAGLEAFIADEMHREARDG